MRTIRAITDDHQYFSSRASETARVLAGGGIAFVWLLAGSDLKGLTDWPLLAVCLLLVLTLVADALHYVIGAASLDSYMVALEEKHPKGDLREETRVEAPDDPSRWLFWTKLALVGLAYVALGGIVIRRIVVAW